MPSEYLQSHFLPIHGVVLVITWSQKDSWFLDWQYAIVSRHLLSWAVVPPSYDTPASFLYS